MNDFAALVLEQVDGKVTPAMKRLTEAELPPGDVTVAVEYSDLNYKDGMVAKGIGRLVRDYPHVPGVDLAGTVAASDDSRFAPGDRVVLTGWRVGEVHWGGYAQRARVRGDWLVKLPDGVSTQQAAAVGTAGFTAMLAVQALEDHGLGTDRGTVLATGAAGGVGSVACAILAHLGYTVAGSTGRPAQADYLRELGVTEIVDRSELAEGSGRPLESERWAGCIDSVGGTTLATVLAQMAYGGSVAACGLAGGVELKTTVIPFLLRGVNVLGIDSVMQPQASRERVWARIAKGDLPLDKLAALTQVAPLAEVPVLADAILNGQVRGRTVIDVNA